MNVMKRCKSIVMLLLAVPTLFTTNVMAQETVTSAQELNKPTLEDLIPGGETYRRPETLPGLQWWCDVCIRAEKKEIKTVDPKNGKESLLIDLKTINQALKKAELPHARSLSAAQFLWSDQKQLLLPLSGKYIVYNWESDKVIHQQSFPRKAANIDYHAESNHVAYTLGNNLYVNGQPVTKEPKGIVCGQSVHRNEFGISKGTFWSPDGNLLAFYRMDESMVSKYPLVDVTARVGKVNPVRYPMAGMTSHKVQVGVYHPETGKIIYLNTGDPTDRYFTNISWSPDARSIYLIELNRDQNHSKLCKYNAETGELMAILLEEKHPKYVEPQSPILFLPWDNNKFIYQSQKDGYNHLYLADLNTKSKEQASTAGVEELTPTGGSCIQHIGLKQLTSGNWLVQNILGFNLKKKEVIIASTEKSPLQTNLYKVNIATGKRTLLGSAEGVHYARLSATGKYIIDNYSTPKVPRNINLVTVQNGKEINLFTAKNPYESFDMPTVEVGTIKAADGKTDLYYRLVKPADFDSSKQYPAIVYVYGGPHAQMIKNGWMNDARGWDLYMAGKGYIMFSLDNRGSSNRGLEFENATFRQLGIEECKDQVKGVEFLKSQPYIDGNRIGVHGWSFGGHMTTALMLRYPEIFKVGVAGGPVIDWSYYEVMYGERYMDTPQSNPEGYKASNLKNLAGNLKGHLLLIHDDHDDTCVPQHTLSFIKACVDARTYPDMFIYPGHKHNVLGRDRVHLHEKITRYFEDYL